MRGSIFRVVAGLFCLATAVPGLAAASPVGLLSFQFCQDSGDTPSSCFFPPDVVTATAATVANVQHQFTNGAGLIIGSENAKVDLATYTLGASASVTLTNWPGGTFETSPGFLPSAPTAAYAELDDQWTVSNGPVSSGFLDVTWTADGILSTSGVGFAAAKLFVGIDNNSCTTGKVPIANLTLTCLFPFSLGVPMDITASLLVLGSVRDFGVSNPYDASAMSDFFNTARLTSVVITDAVGNIDPGAFVIAASGATIPTVPEPSSLSLVVLGGLVSLAWYCQRAR